MGTGSLIAGQPCVITISCTAVDPNGQVGTVLVDLSQIGGSEGQTLTGNANQWTWSGKLTPPASGSKTITFAAVNNRSITGRFKANIIVLANQPPSLANATATGNLIQAQACALTVSCSASDPDGTVQAVTANLSQIGGPVSQTLTSSGGRWTWSGTVTPPTTGSMSIVFSAADNQSLTATTTANATVVAKTPDVIVPTGLPANAPLSLMDMAASGTLLAGKACQIIVSCSATDVDGTVQSVTADLSRVGGPASQGLTSDGYYWTWVGTLTPPTGGAQAITFTATGADGKTITASAIAGVVDPRVTIKIPGVTKPDTGPTWIEANRVVQGQPCSVTIVCGTSVAAADARSVVADLSSIGGPSSQPLAYGGNQWTWSGTATAPASGIQQITLRSTDSQNTTTTVPTIVGVTDSQVLRGSWLFVIGSSVPKNTTQQPRAFEDYIDRFVEGVRTSHVPVVLLDAGLWDWDTGMRYPDSNPSSPLIAMSSFTEAQVTYMVKKLREVAGVTVGFHSCPTGNCNTGNYAQDHARLSAWLFGDSKHQGATAKLAMLNAKASFADGSPWSNIAFYEQSLRQAIGPDGILLEGDIGVDGFLSEGNAHFLYLDGSSSHDQADLSNTYTFANPRQYVDRRIAEVLYNKTIVPAWTRLEIGWTGECIEWWISPTPAVTLWPLSDYEYAWGRSHESGIPLTYRVTMESLTRPNDQRLLQIGRMEQDHSTTANVARRWNSLAISADGTKLVAAAYGGRLYTSVDAGATWTERQPVGNSDKTWSCLAMSGSGTTIAAGAWNGSLYISADGGATWAQRKPGAADKFWERLAMSADGTRMIARLSTSGREFYVSADAGATWTQDQVPGAGILRNYNSWSSVAMSADGSTVLLTDNYKLHAARHYGQSTKTWASNDFGASWPTWDDATAMIAGYPGIISRSCIATSSDGTRMLSGSWPGRLYQSLDAGTTWRETQPLGGVDQCWQCVAMSSDGTTAIAGTWYGRLYAGVYNDQTRTWTWTEVQPTGSVDKYWESVAMSSNGKVIIATDGDWLYTSIDAGATWTQRLAAGQ